MPLTVAEKEHWKARIHKRIDKKIDAITGSVSRRSKPASESADWSDQNQPA